MKKIILFLVAALFSVTIQAAKALHVPTTITQSDGAKLTIIVYGDEDFHYYTTADGVLLFHKGYDYFIAGVNDNGELVCTTQLAHEPSERTAEEVELIRLQDKNKFLASAAKRVTMAKAKRIGSAASITNTSTLFPHTGSPRVLVILAEFSDVKFTVNEPRKAFEQYLNAEGHDIMEDLGNDNRRNVGSVAQYFTDMSFGKFTPQFDIYGPVTLDGTLKHYGEGDDRMDLFIPDVCKAVDGEVDFKDYDQNGDGYADLVYVIYAGYSGSVAGNSSDCIWPKSGTPWSRSNTDPGDFGVYDGIKVYRYGVNNELNYTPQFAGTFINGIGLFCHEFSHCMGMPDLYVTKAASAATQIANNQEMEYWSIMDSGTYLGNGYIPTAYTAWEREFFGWFDIETLNAPTAVELRPIDNGGKAYRIMNDNDNSGNEYYIVENIQKKKWNLKQYGHGMLVLHVDYDENIFSLSSNSVNNTLGHPRMTVLAADGLLLNGVNRGYDENGKLEEGNMQGAYFLSQAAGDPFPGTSGVHELTDETQVKPIVYTGTVLNKPIYDIQEDTNTGIVTFKFLDPNATSIKDAIIDKEYNDNRIYTLDGRYVGTKAETLKKGVYIINNKKVVIE